MNGESQHSNELSSVVDLMREVSRQADPHEALQTYKSRTRDFMAVDRTVSVSRRGLPAPQYHITHSDIWKVDINPWKQPESLPLLDRGLLGELLYAGEPRLIDDLRVPPDDPAADHLEGMGSLAAIPHFDEGAAINMVVHLRRGTAAFDRAQFPQWVLMSGLFGRAMRGLVQADELRQAQDRLREEYRAVTDLSDTVLAQARTLKAHAVTLEDRVRRRTIELEQAHLDAIFMLAAASEERDAETGRHLRRMQEQTYQLALELGRPESESRTLSHAAVLHDVGKLHVPDEILMKPGPLTAEERQIVQGHTLAGERILADRPYFTVARCVARSHHENWDGSGYPDGLAGEAIPLEARIVHLVDVFDALTSVRPYKLAWPVAQALSFLQEQCGRMFDPHLVPIFLSLQQSAGRDVTAQIRKG